jgi:glycosyltransferase involved in cell wall biosynthesis
MTDTPLFSVVTVTLNCAEDALITAQSVLAQEFLGFEYIVKDGGSTDGTVERLQNLGIKVLVCPDQGIYDAMNQALEISRGKYVYFINTGDLFYSSKVLSDIAASLNFESEICYGNLHILPMNRILVYPNHLSRYFLFRKNISHQAFMVKRDVYLSLGKFDTSFRYVADQEFLWKLIMEKGSKPQYLDIIFASYLYGGLTTRQSSETLVAKERWILMKHYFSPLEFILYGLMSFYFLNPFKSWIWYNFIFQNDE